MLVKPPERSCFNFGTFSLAAVAAAVRDLAGVVILDATDLTAGEAVRQIARRRPDLVGVTTMGLSSVPAVAELIRRIKARAPGGKARPPAACVAGGHGASMCPDVLLDAGADAVVIGEGEVVFRRIVAEGIAAGSPGTACRQRGRTVLGPPQPLIEPLDALAPAARDLMPPRAEAIHLMETSRGCPHACAFCETTRFYRRRWRGQSPMRVVAEVRRLLDEFDAWIVHITDDNFTADRRRVRAICRQLLDGDLPAMFMVSARADDLIADPDLLPAMARARMLRITVGVETLDSRTALAAGKPIPPAAYREAFARMRQLGIFSVASLIVGIPGESREARARAVELAVEAAPDLAHFLPFLPLPGIPLRLGRAGFDPDPADVADAHRFTRAFFEHPSVGARLGEAASRDDVRGLLARATIQNRLHGATAAPQWIVDSGRSRFRLSPVRMESR